ncbi:hypothetical protein [Paraglaciecola sp.]|uniref:hypothetical protein n=3 Tax=Paraglaciecola sp. TaxID=1920173 RepID=UPI00329A55F6
MTMQTTLEDVISYKNDDVIDRFIKIYGIEKDQATIIFNSTKKWIWLCYYRRKVNAEQNLVIDSPLVIIDEMWHNFVLFTKGYSEFCKRFFGHYMHHAPTSSAMQKEAMETFRSLSPDAIQEKLIEQKRWQYEFVYDHLGKDEFLLWYKQYPKQYSPLSLAKLAYENEQKKLIDREKMMQQKDAA